MDITQTVIWIALMLVAAGVWAYLGFEHHFGHGFKRVKPESKPEKKGGK